MNIWVSVEAINAEVEYRRERNAQVAGLARIGRQIRAERSRRRRLTRLHRTESERNGHTQTTGDGRTPEATVPAQRTSGSSPATKQPV